MGHVIDEIIFDLRQLFLVDDGIDDIQECENEDEEKIPVISSHADNPSKYHFTL